MAASLVAFAALLSGALGQATSPDTSHPSIRPMPTADARNIMGAASLRSTCDTLRVEKAGNCNVTGATDCTAACVTCTGSCSSAAFFIISTAPLSSPLLGKAVPVDCGALASTYTIYNCITVPVFGCICDDFIGAAGLTVPCIAAPPGIIACLITD